MRSATALIDADGLEALTMRRLASDLGLKLPAIYRVFANKQAILDRVAEAVLTQALPPPGPSTTWQQEVKDLARCLRRAILEQRDGARIVGGSYAAHRNSLALADRIIAALMQGGFAGRPALWATTTVFCYVLGETIEQQGASGQAVDLLATFSDQHAYPHLFATPTDQLVNFDDRFEFGLSVVVGGLLTLKSEADSHLDHVELSAVE